MGSHKSNQIEGTIKSLSIEEQDLLMQYIYKGFEAFNKDSQTCSNLLNWHSQLVKITGDGAIVRVLTDRRRL
jgi:actin related protein 2/3 complex subunit 5